MPGLEHVISVAPPRICAAIFWLRDSDCGGGRCGCCGVPAALGGGDRRPAGHNHLHLGHHGRAEGRDADPHEPEFECDRLASKRMSLYRGDVALSFLPLAHVYERDVDYGYLFRGVSVAYVAADGRRGAGAAGGASDDYGRGAAILRKDLREHYGARGITRRGRSARFSIGRCTWRGSPCHGGRTERTPRRA